MLQESSVSDATIWSIPDDHQNAPKVINYATTVINCALRVINYDL